MKKVLSLVLAAVMCLSFIPFVKADAAANVKRLAGPTRFETMLEISNEGWTKSDCVILVNGLRYADALSAVTLAKKYDAPILLTTGLILEEFITDQIKALGAKMVIIVGGKSVVPESFEMTLMSKLLLVERVYGSDRYATGVAVAKKLGAYDTAVIATGTGYADALSIGPYAAMKGYPILYCDPACGLTDDVKQCISGKNLIVVGGEKVVPSRHLPSGFTRISGQDRYMTSYEIAKKYASEFGDSVVIATGENFPDALSGGAFCAKIKAPMLLVNNSTVLSQTKNWIKARNLKTLYVIGGQKTIPDSTVSGIFA